MPRTLSHAEARAVYDRIGSRQDWQGFYENAAKAELVLHGDFEHASRVLEFGCGTGSFGEELLAGPLPETATWVGLDQSRTMFDLATRRLARFGARAEVRRTDGAPAFDLPDASVDRVVSTYVLDLLSEEDVGAVLAEARRVLVPGGLLALAGLGHATSRLGRLVEGTWCALHRFRPALVGGCRPLAVVDRLADHEWKLRHHRVIERFGLASETLVAEKIGG